jgi:hypothetical protein
MLAHRQHGHVTRAQLLGLGLKSGAISRLIASGPLIVVHAGVYAVGHRPTDPVAKAHAAVLACSQGAVLSHSSAAVLWGLLKRWELPLHVMVPGDRRTPGITIHRCTKLTRRDRRGQHGIPATSPARTTLDITPRLTDRALLRVLSDGRRAGYLHLDSLRDVIARNPRHPGTRSLSAAVEDAPENPTRSGLEDAFRAFVKRFGLPTPRINSRLNGCEVDAVFEAERLIVELDGWEYHNDHAAFDADRERDADALYQDWEPIGSPASVSRASPRRRPRGSGRF